MSSRFNFARDHFRGGYGTVYVPGYSSSLVISDRRGPVSIEMGVSEPKLTGQLHREFPNNTDEVVVEILEETPGDYKIISWGLATEWRSVQDQMAAVLYRVISEERHNGAIVKYKHQVFIGTAKQLADEYTRDDAVTSLTDKFAFKHYAKGIVTRSRIERKNSDGTWTECEDPRPIVRKPRYMLMHHKNGSARTLAIGFAQDINDSFPRGANDPLSVYHDRRASDDYVYWLRKNKDGVWDEVHDPRPVPTAVPVSKSVPAQVKPSVCQSVKVTEKQKHAQRSRSF